MFRPAIERIVTGADCGGADSLLGHITANRRKSAASENTRLSPPTSHPYYEGFCSAVSRGGADA